MWSKMMAFHVGLKVSYLHKTKAAEQIRRVSVARQANLRL